MLVSYKAPREVNLLLIVITNDKDGHTSIYTIYLITLSLQTMQIRVGQHVLPLNLHCLPLRHYILPNILLDETWNDPNIQHGSVDSEKFGSEEFN